MTFTEKDLNNLCCPKCQGSLRLGVRTRTAGSGLSYQLSVQCTQCAEKFPVTNGIPRLLLSPLREALLGTGSATGIDAQQVATAQSFGFEWDHFSEMRSEWEQAFLDYMMPHGPGFFVGKRVLDAGCGSGRYAYYAARYGADVWAVDLGSAVDVARRNTANCVSVHIVQADLYHLPFAPESFDFIYSLGVLHHLPDPEAAFRNLLGFLKPSGEIQIYLYWKPEGQPLKRALLSAITATRQITTRLPHRAIYVLAFPAALMAYTFFVLPYKVLSRIPGLKRFAELMPMKQYARYRFHACLLDQHDRLSAPIENRYTKAEVEAWLKRAGLEEVNVRPNYGWVGSGRKPESVAGQSASDVRQHECTNLVSSSLDRDIHS